MILLSRKACLVAFEVFFDGIDAIDAVRGHFPHTTYL